MTCISLVQLGDERCAQLAYACQRYFAELPKFVQGVEASECEVWHHFGPSIGARLIVLEHAMVVCGLSISISLWWLFLFIWPVPGGRAAQRAGAAHMRRTFEGERAVRSAGSAKPRTAP